MDKEARQAMLAATVRRNPFVYLSLADIACLFGFGEKSMRALAGMEPPMVAGKINPEHFIEWLSANRERIGKLTV